MVVNKLDQVADRADTLQRIESRVRELNPHAYVVGATGGRIDPALLYDIATAALTAVFTARFVVQFWLYGEQSVAWLAVARIAMGYPLTALALLVVVWAIRGSRRTTSSAATPRAGTDPGSPLRRTG